MWGDHRSGKYRPGGIAARPRPQRGDRRGDLRGPVYQSEASKKLVLQSEREKEPVHQFWSIYYPFPPTYVSYLKKNVFVILGGILGKLFLSYQSKIFN